MTLKPVLYYCIFDNGFENCATGTDVANISLYAEGSLFFFKEKKEVWLIMHSSLRALKLHGLIKVDAKMRKKQKNKKQKKQKNQQNVYQKLKQVSSACSISQSLLSSVVNMFQMTFSWEKKISTTLWNVRGNCFPGIGPSRSCIRSCLHQAVNLCFYHRKL